MEDKPSDLSDIERPVRTFVTKRVIGVKPDTTVQEAAKRMVEFNISSLTVVEDDQIIGFFTDGDIKKRVVAEGLSPDIPVENIMTTDLITSDIDMDVKDVLELMADKNIKHMLIEEKGEIVGILTFGDLIDIQKQKLETYISRE